VDAADPRHVGIRQPAQAARQLGGHHRAGGHGLAVQPFAVAEAGLDGMAEGVPRLSVARSPCSVSSAATTSALLRQERSTASARASIAGQQALEIGLDPFEEGQVADQAVLDDLGEAGLQLAVRQGAEGGSASTSRGW
jgi:hypothetical protein